MRVSSQSCTATVQPQAGCSWPGQLPHLVMGWGAQSRPLLRPDLRLDLPRPRPLPRPGLSVRLKRGTVPLKGRWSSVPLWVWLRRGKVPLNRPVWLNVPFRGSVPFQRGWGKSSVPLRVWLARAGFGPGAGAVAFLGRSSFLLPPFLHASQAGWGG